MKSKAKQTDESVTAAKSASAVAETAERRNRKQKKYRLPNEIVLSLILAITFAGTLIILSQIGFWTTPPATPAPIPQPSFHP